MFQLSLKILLAVLVFANLAFTNPIEDLTSTNSGKMVIISAHTENIDRTVEHVINADKLNNQNETSKDAGKNATIIDHQNKTSSNVEGTQQLIMHQLRKHHQQRCRIQILLRYWKKKKEEGDDHINKTASKQRPVEETTPINQVTEITNASNLTGEQKDLIEVSVSPHDEEDDVTTIVPIPNKTNSSVDNVTEVIIVSSTTVITVDDVPIKNDKHNNESINNEHNDNVKSTTYQANTSESINVTTETTETAESAESSSTTTTSKSIKITTTTVVSSENDQVEVGISTVSVEKEKKIVEQAELNVKSKQLSTNEKDNSGSMPPGIIVLVTALSFAVAIIAGYGSIVIWKQYLEHRYGRRELLVNELEFDTNDLRHFEV
ncbi:hypothetical protein M0802_007072 [Mischocyttarus mexicanus]|nr:hypothetical protein M0802_007072 [Mischocyttarus mexicanus]